MSVTRMTTLAGCGGGGTFVFSKKKTFFSIKTDFSIIRSLKHLL